MNVLLRLLYAVSSFFGWLFHFIYNSRVRYVFYRMRRAFSTQLFKREFKTFGEGSILDFPSLIKSPGQISVGCGCTLNEGLLLRCYGSGAEIVIGDGSALGAHSSVSCACRIEIGRGVRTGRMVIITDNSHGNNSTRAELDISPIARPVVSKGPVVIDDNVWIGEKASVMPGVHIGKGAVIGANAVVTRDIPPYSLAAGCPARVIKTIEV